MTAVTVAVLAVWVGVAVLAGRHPTPSPAASSLGGPAGSGTGVFPGAGATPILPGGAPGIGTYGGGTARRGTSGTIDSVHGAALTVTARNGQVVTVATSGATTVSQVVGIPVADITPGESVIAVGTSSPDDESLVAVRIMITPPGSGTVGGFGGSQGAFGPAGGTTSGGIAGGTAGGGSAAVVADVASGTVTATTKAALTVTESDGTVVQVLTSRATASTRVDTSVAALQVGQQVVVRGTINGDGSVDASDIQEGVADPGFGRGSGPAPAGPADPTTPPTPAAPASGTTGPGLGGGTSL
jgi:hypothetical protein